LSAFGLKKVSKSLRPIFSLIYLYDVVSSRPLWILTLKTVEQFIQEFVDSACDLGELSIVSESDAKLLDNFNTFLSLLQTLLNDDALEDDSIQRNALLRLFEISSHALHIRVRNNEEDGEQINEVIETIFSHSLNSDENNSKACWSIVKALSEAGFKLSENLMKSIFSQQVDDQEPLSDEGQFESAVQAMKLALHDANIDSDIGFYELYKTEFALLPNGAEEFIFALLSHQGKSWTIDAILLFLLHPDDAVKQGVLEIVKQIPAAELANKPRLARLVCIRNLLAEDNKKNLDPVIRSVLKSNRDFQACPDKVQIKQIYSSIADNAGAHSILVLSDNFLWAGILKQSQGIIDDIYIADMPSEQQHEIVQRMSEQFPMYRVTEAFLEEVLPWFIAKSTINAGISPHGLLFLEQMPAHFSQPQPMSVALRLSTLFNGTATPIKVRESSLASNLLIDDFPNIKNWLMPEQCQHCRNEDEVITHVVEANKQEWAERLIITSLIAKHASHTLDIFSKYPGHKLNLRAETEQDCLLLAHAILHKDLKKSALLSSLATHAFHVMQEQQDTSTQVQAVSYQVKISLHAASPKIWRRIKLSSQTSLDELHLILQVAMGWKDMHLYAFNHQGHILGPQQDDGREFGSNSIDTDKITIGELLQNEGETLQYSYDFGDDWQHSLELEKIGKKDQSIPIVTTGSCACPPEDCGGIEAYKNLCRIIKNPKHPSYQQTLDWLGEFDPKAFNKASINEQLGQYFAHKE